MQLIAATPDRVIVPKTRSSGGDGDRVRPKPGGHEWRASVDRATQRGLVVTAFPMLLLGLASHAAAQTAGPPPSAPTELSNLSLEELARLRIDSVYGASQFTQKVTEAPSSITIITAEEIQRYGHRTLADVLRSVRGFYVTNDRNYSYLGVRGFSRPGDYNARVLLLVDGHRLNDNIFGAALIGTEFPLDVDLIDRVEIIRGPSSSLYGTSAFFAVINVITKRGNAMTGVEAAGSLGTFDTQKGRVTYGRSWRTDSEAFVSASVYRSDGERHLFFEEFDSPETNSGIAENADADEYVKLFGRMQARNFTLHGLYGNRDKTIPTASFGTVFNNPGSHTIERRGYVDLAYDSRMATGWELTSRAYFDHYGYDGDYVFERGEEQIPGLVVNKDLARGDWWGAELKVATKLRSRHTVAFGSEIRNNIRQNQANYDDEPRLEYLDDRRGSTSWAVFAQDEVALHRKVILNLGLRHDRYHTFGGTTNPRAGLIYQPFESTSVKVLYGQAFRAPNAYELFWQQQDVAKANAALRPETNKTTEVVLEQYLGSHVRVAATGFHYGISGLITQQTDPVDDLLVFRNVESVRANGFEVEAEGKWASDLRVRIGHTYEDSRNEDTSLPLTNSPKHLAKVNVMAPVAGPHLLAGVEVQYVSARRTITGAEVPGVVLSNLTWLSHGLARNLEVSAGVYNVFDERYGDPGSEEHRQDAIVQYGRTFRLKITVKFPQ